MSIETLDFFQAGIDGGSLRIRNRYDYRPPHIIERDASLKRVADNAGATFRKRAQAFVLEFLSGQPDKIASGEAITDACKDAGIIPPNDDRAFGPVYFSLARAGRIVRAGACERRKGHGTAGGILWSLPE